MEVEIGRGKKARRAYGFDDIAIVPSRRTRDPDDVDVSWTLGPYRFEIPLLASAMDGVVSPETAGLIGRLGVTTVVDTDGDPLRRAVRAEPDVITPNVLEAEELVGHEFNEDEDHVIAVHEMAELGAREAIMTAPDGCYAAMAPTEPGASGPLYRVRLAPGLVEPHATVGSGDAFLAGFVAARYGGSPAEDALAYAVACGAESTRHLGAGLVDPGYVARLLDAVEVERRELPAGVG